MIRPLTGIGFALALVGTAHAQEAQVAIKLDGKSPRAVRSEIYRAAEQVCANDTAFNLVDTTCVEATYQEAMKQVRAAPRIERAAYERTSAPGVH